MKWLAVIAVILKFIGIAVLLLLAILLIAVLVVMLSPVKYDVDGSYSDGSGRGKAFLSYLFGLIRFDIRYDNDGLIYNIKIPFVDVDKLLSEPDEKVESKAKINNTDFADSEKSDNSVDKDTVFKSTDKTDDTPVTIMQTDKQGQKKQKRKHKSKVSGKPKNRAGFGIGAVYNKVVSFLKEYELKKLYKPIKRFFRRFGKAVGLKIALIDVTFGFDDPSLTGVVLGGCSALAVYMPVTFKLSGCFEGSFFKGNARLKGKTCLLALLIPIIRLVLEKPVWNIITKLTKD